MTDFLWGLSVGVTFTLFVIALVVIVLAETRGD
jgi:hypothetical protein